MVQTATRCHVLVSAASLQGMLFRSHGHTCLPGSTHTLKARAWGFPAGLAFNTHFRSDWVSAVTGLALGAFTWRRLDTPRRGLPRPHEPPMSRSPHSQAVSLGTRGQGTRDARSSFFSQGKITFGDPDANYVTTGMDWNG